MINITKKEIERKAYHIYKKKLQLGIPDGSMDNNAETNWKEAKEYIEWERSIIKLSHESEQN